MRGRVNKKKRIAALAASFLLGLSGGVKADPVSAFLIIDASQNSGGLESGFTARGLAGLSFEKALSKNVVFHADGLVQRGDDGSAKTADIQAYSNIDAADFTKLNEIWLQASFFSEQLRLKAGQVDANSEFAVAEHALEFIHSSMGFSPTIAYLPTYPSPTLSANLFYQYNANGEVGVGIYSDSSNSFDDIFAIAEGRWQLSMGELKLGYWRWQGDVTALASDDTVSNTHGWYATLGGDFTPNSAMASDAGWYLQLGVGDKDRVDIDQHLGAGLVWYGPNNRENDITGVGVSYVSTSSLRNAELAGHETAFELFYKYQFSEHIALKPDLQFILSPAANKAASNAVVATLRVELTL